MEQKNQIVLFSAVFLIIGFLIGICTDTIDVQHDGEWLK
jgi:hypothetical protein